MRLQLALNVADLSASIEYYEKLFGVAVAKVKPGYANFEVAEPPLKLVLFESANGGDRLNHVGVEVFDDAIVDATAARQAQAGLQVDLQENEGCCFARQNKAVTYAPDGTMWEWYRKVDDLDDFGADEVAVDQPKEASACCTANSS